MMYAQCCFCPSKNLLHDSLISTLLSALYQHPSSLSTYQEPFLSHTFRCQTSAKPFKNRTFLPRMYKDHGLRVNKINKKPCAFNILRISFATASSSALGQAGWLLCREPYGGAAGWGVLPSGARQAGRRDTGAGGGELGCTFYRWGTKQRDLRSCHTREFY